VHLAIFGGPERPPAGEAGALPFPATWIGSIREEETLARLYAAADILIAPFIEDNLPNVVLEAAACGLPVAAFRTGGIPDIVEHQETGWLAPAGDDGSLAEGIEWLLADRVRRSVLGLAARNRVVNEFTLKRCANAWICLLKGTEEEHPAS
jgi:glycosyltransferase involved in cell wall biosynthesis